MDHDNQKDKREGGLPGGGACRKDDMGGPGVFPRHPLGDAPFVGNADRW